MDHFQDFLKVLKAMEVEYILIGGFAVILHGQPRFTMDMDFFIQMVEQNVHKLRKALYSTFIEYGIWQLFRKAGSSEEDLGSSILFLP